MFAESLQQEMGSGNGLNLDLHGERARHLAFSGDWKRLCDFISHVNRQMSALTVYSNPNFANTYLQSLLWKNAVTLTPFDFNDAVETQAYDHIDSCLVIASHLGLIKMFSVEKGVENGGSSPMSSSPK